MNDGNSFMSGPPGFWSDDDDANAAGGIRASHGNFAIRTEIIFARRPGCRSSAYRGSLPLRRSRGGAKGVARTTTRLSSITSVTTGQCSSRQNQLLVGSEAGINPASTEQSGAKYSKVAQAEHARFL
jgi:hypothetical protein